jgi:hypothetical protein
MKSEERKTKKENASALGLERKMPISLCASIYIQIELNAESKRREEREKERKHK